MKRGKTRIKKENKFVVINKKYLKVLYEINPQAVMNFINAYINIAPFLPAHKYYVVNQDEPYADKIWEIIKEGEKGKTKEAK